MDKRGDDALQSRVKRAEQDMFDLKTSQLVGAKSFDLKESSLSKSYNLSAFEELHVLITFTAEKQENSFAELNYSYSDFFYVEKLRSTPDSKVTVFRARLTNYTSSPVTQNITWNVLSTDKGTITA